MTQVPIDGVPSNEQPNHESPTTEESPIGGSSSKDDVAQRQLCPEMLHERLNRQKRRLNSSSLDTPASGETPRAWSQSVSPEPCRFVLLLFIRIYRIYLLKSICTRLGQWLYDTGTTTSIRLVEYIIGIEYKYRIVRSFRLYAKEWTSLATTIDIAL